MTVYDGLWRYYTAFTLFLSYITKYDVFKSLNDASLVYSPDLLQFSTKNYSFPKITTWNKDFSKIMRFLIEFSMKQYFTIGQWSIRSCSKIRSWLFDHSRKVYDHLLNIISDLDQNRIFFGTFWDRLLSLKIVQFTTTTVPCGILI